MNSPARAAGARRPRNGVAHLWAGTTVPLPASPAETVIFYPPWEATAATRRLPAVDGPAAIEADPSLPQRHLHLVAGTGLTATTATNPTVPARSRTGTANPNTSGVHGVAGSDALVPNSAPLFFDPTACPA